MLHPCVTPGTPREKYNGRKRGRVINGLTRTHGKTPRPIVRDAQSIAKCSTARYMSRKQPRGGQETRAGVGSGTTIFRFAVYTLAPIAHCTHPSARRVTEMCKRTIACRIARIQVRLALLFNSRVARAIYTCTSIRAGVTYATYRTVQPSLLRGRSAGRRRRTRDGRRQPVSGRCPVDTLDTER